MPMSAVEIERLILEFLPDARVAIEDLAGDGDHYRATIVAEAFRGKSRLQQHQLPCHAIDQQRGAERPTHPAPRRSHRRAEGEEGRPHGEGRCAERGKGPRPQRGEGRTGWHARPRDCHARRQGRKRRPRRRLR